MSVAKPRFWRANLLGVINALIYTSVLFVAEKVVGYEGWPRVRWAWVSITVLFVVCFALASYLVHRMWSQRASSIVLLWLGVGFIAVSVWNILWFAQAYWERHTTNLTVGWNEVTAINNPEFGVFSLALVFATNLVFGAALKLALRQYLVGQVEWSR